MGRAINRMVRDGARQSQMPNGWMVCVNGLVADVDDPEGLHRIRVIIPSIEEDLVHDEWVTALMPWVGPTGYGPFNLPVLGSEVLLFGRLGQKHMLFYLSSFNEDYEPPAEFAGNVRGLKTDGAYKLLADLLIEIISQQMVKVRATNQVDVQAALVRLLGGDSEVVRVEPSKIGVLGAAAIVRQTLPPAATDLPTCITLANGIRQMLIQFGFAE